jgi:hypothetical protein
VQKTHAGPNAIVALVQHLDKVSIDPTRRYAELSVRWISWYIGPFTLALGIVGAAALAYLFARGSLRVQPATIALLLGPPALLSIWWPSTTPDQLWAARRFLPAVFPGLLLLAFALLCAVARDRTRPFLAERRFAVVLLAVAAVAFPLVTISDVSEMTEQRGLFSVITDACTKIGPRGAVVMLAETRPASHAYLSDPQALRSFCDVPVIVMPGRTRAPALLLLANQWRAQGRRLFVVSEFPASILRVLPTAVVQPTLVGEELHMLEPTLSGGPSNYAPNVKPFGAVTQLMIAAVPAAPRARVPAG